MVGPRLPDNFRIARHPPAIDGKRRTGSSIGESALTPVHAIVGHVRQLSFDTLF